LRQRSAGNSFVSSICGDERTAPGLEDVHLVLDGHQRAARGHERERGVAAGGVRDHAENAAVDEALLLGQVVAVRQRDLDLAGLDALERRTDQRHRFLPAEALPDAGGEMGVRRTHSLGSVVDVYVNVNYA